MDESTITKLVNDIQNERNKLFTELKNDTELTKANSINQKLSVLDTMLKSVFKYRNLCIKERLTFKL
jgi:predicted nucleotide-binding protein (sugar kinase/HSP70/actin superfamily)